MTVGVPGPLRPADRIVLEVIVSFYRDPDGVTVADVADEVGVTRHSAAGQITRLRGRRLVGPPGVRALVERHEAGGMRSSDAQVFGCLPPMIYDGEPVTVPDIAAATGLNPRQVAASLTRLRARGVVSPAHAMYPTPAGLAYIHNPTGELRPGVYRLTVRRSPLWWRGSCATSMLVGLAVARELDDGGSVLDVPKLSERLRMAEADVQDVVLAMIEDRVLAPWWR